MTLHDQHSHPPWLSGRSAEPRTDSNTVWVVSANGAVRRDEIAFLQASGYDCLSLKSVEQALGLAGHERPGALLIDQTLPDGAAFGGRMRHSGGIPRIAFPGDRTELLRLLGGYLLDLPGEHERVTIQNLRTGESTIFAVTEVVAARTLLLLPSEPRDSFTSVVKNVDRLRIRQAIDKYEVREWSAVARDAHRTWAIVEITDFVSRQSRRKALRKAVCVDVRVDVPYGDRVSGHTRNLCLGGALVDGLSTALPLGLPCTLDLALDARDARDARDAGAVTLRGVVRHVAPSAQGCFSVGLSFEASDFAACDQVVEFLFGDRSHGLL